MAGKLQLNDLTATILGKIRGFFAWPIFVANGMLGGNYIADTSTHTGTWTTIDCVTDTVFDSSTVCNIAGLAASNATFPAGKQLFGNFTTVKLTSGSVIAYQ